MHNKVNLMFSKDRIREMSTYMRNVYLITDILKETKVWEGGPIPITCPFHPDSRPSFYIDIEGNSFKCYSCGAYGSYASFYHEYMSKHEEDGKTFNQHMEEILSRDKEMQETLGYSTLFVKSGEDFTFDNALHMDSYVPHQPKRLVLRTYAKCLDRLTDVAVKLDAMADIERGMSEEALWDKYINEKYISLDASSEVMQTLQKGLIDILSEDEDGEDVNENKIETNLF